MATPLPSEFGDVDAGLRPARRQPPLQLHVRYDAKHFCAKPLLSIAGHRRVVFQQLAFGLGISWILRQALRFAVAQESVQLYDENKNTHEGTIIQVTDVRDPASDKWQYKVQFNDMAGEAQVLGNGRIFKAGCAPTGVKQLPEQHPGAPKPKGQLAGPTLNLVALRRSPNCSDVPTVLHDDRLALNACKADSYLKRPRTGNRNEKPASPAPNPPKNADTPSENRGGRPHRVVKPSPLGLAFVDSAFVWWKDKDGITVKQGDHVRYNEGSIQDEKLHFGTVSESPVGVANDDEEGPLLWVHFWCSPEGEIEPEAPASYRADSCQLCDSAEARIIHAAEESLEDDDFEKFKRDGKVWNCSCTSRSADSLRHRWTALNGDPVETSPRSEPNPKRPRKTPTKDAGSEEKSPGLTRRTSDRKRPKVVASSASVWWEDKTVKRGDHVEYEDTHLPQFGTVVRDAAAGHDEEGAGPLLWVHFWCTADSFGQGKIEPTVQSEDLSYPADACKPCSNDSEHADIIHAAEDRLEGDDPETFKQFKLEEKVWNCKCKTRIDIDGVISDGPARCELQVTSLSD